MRAYRLIAASLLTALLCLPGAAQQGSGSYPDRNLRMVVGFPAGTTTDAIGRIVAEALGSRLGQRIVVENRPGASGNLSAGVVAQSEPDGYTLYLGAVGLASTVAVNPKAVQADPVTGLSHVGLVSYSTNILIAGPNSAIASVEDIRNKAKDGTSLTFGSSGVGGGLHLTGEMFKLLTRTNLVHVPYRGSAAAVTDLLSGRLDLQFDNLAGALNLIREGKVRALAVTSSRRAKDLPDVPTMAEAGVPGLEAGAWFGLMAPPNTPAPIVERLAKELREAQAEPSFRAFFERLGMEVVTSQSPAEFRNYVAQDVERWRRMVKETGVKLEGN